MIEAATRLARPGHLQFRLGEIERWWPDRPVDLIISNAALQWVPTHIGLMRRWFTAALAPGGTLAVQMPPDSDATNTIRNVATSARWAGRLGVVAHGAGPRGRSSVREPIVYAETLASLSAEVDVWETTYLHLLTGDDPVLEWFAGTGLRPYLDAFGDDEVARTDFRADVAASLRETFPRRDYGTILPFRRIFAVARIATRAG
jgi:trans-aconitate 2-methyltransferase